MAKQLLKLAARVRCGMATDAELGAIPFAELQRMKSDSDYEHFRASNGKPVLIKMDDDDDEDHKNTLVRHVASDELKDRGGDRIKVSGWELGEFRGNPQFLAQHNHDAPIGLVVHVARGRSNRTNERALLTDTRLHEPAKMVFPFPEALRALILSGELPAVSVGFLPGEVKFPRDQEEREEMGVGRFGALFVRGHVLLELSSVSVPANPNALRERGAAAERDKLFEELVTRGLVDRAEVEEFRKAFPQTGADIYKRAERRRSFVDYADPFAGQESDIQTEESLLANIDGETLVAKKNTISVDLSAVPEAKRAELEAEIGDLVTMTGEGGEKPAKAAGVVPLESATVELEAVAAGPTIHIHLDGGHSSGDKAAAEQSQGVAADALTLAAGVLKDAAAELKASKLDPPADDTETPPVEKAEPTLDEKLAALAKSKWVQGARDEAAEA